MSNPNPEAHKQTYQHLLEELGLPSEASPEQFRSYPQVLSVANVFIHWTDEVRADNDMIMPDFQHIISSDLEKVKGTGKYVRVPKERWWHKGHDHDHHDDHGHEHTGHHTPKKNYVPSSFEAVPGTQPVIGREFWEIYKETFGQQPNIQTTRFLVGGPEINRLTKAGTPIPVSLYHNANGTIDPYKNSQLDKLEEFSPRIPVVPTGISALGILHKAAGIMSVHNLDPTTLTKKFK